MYPITIVTENEIVVNQILCRVPCVGERLIINRELYEIDYVIHLDQKDDDCLEAARVGVTRK